MIVQVEKFMRKWNMVPEGGRVLLECPAVRTLSVCA